MGHDNIVRELLDTEVSDICKDYEISKQAEGGPSWVYKKLGEDSENGGRRWEVYLHHQGETISLSDEQEADFFTAYYLSEGEPQTLVSGQYDERVMKDTLEVLTDNVLEGDSFAGTPLAFGEKGGRNVGGYLPLAVFVAAYGVFMAEELDAFGPENALDAVEPWLRNRSPSELVGLGAGVLGSIYLIHKGGQELGGQLGKYIDQLRLRNLPQEAENFTYGEPVMKGLVREEDGSLTGLNE